MEPLLGAIVLIFALILFVFGVPFALADEKKQDEILQNVTKILCWMRGRL